MYIFLVYYIYRLIAMIRNIWR